MAVLELRKILTFDALYGCGFVVVNASTTVGDGKTASRWSRYLPLCSLHLRWGGSFLFLNYYPNISTLLWGHSFFSQQEAGCSQLGGFWCSCLPPKIVSKINWQAAARLRRDLVFRAGRQGGTLPAVGTLRLTIEGGSLVIGKSDPAGQCKQKNQ